MVSASAENPEEKEVIPTSQQMRRDLLEVCRRLHARGLVAGTDGNVSARLSEDRLLCTPTGMSKGSLDAEDLVICDMNGQRISGKHRLTTEIKIHIAAYEQRTDICAVVHAHPPHATAFAVAHRTLDERLMPEAYISVGKVALTPYGTPSTRELEESIRPAAATHDSLLLANHGAMTLGANVFEAYHRMEALEQLAHISTLAQVLGNATPLTSEQMAKLEGVRSVYGTKTTNNPCYHCGWSPENRTEFDKATGTSGSKSRTDADLSLDELREMARRTLLTLRKTRD